MINSIKALVTSKNTSPVYNFFSILSNAKLVISNKACKAEYLGLNPYCVGVNTE